MRTFLFFLCTVALAETNFFFSMTPVEFRDLEANFQKMREDNEYIGAMYNFTQEVKEINAEAMEKQRVVMCKAVNTMNNVDLNKGFFLKLMEVVTFFATGCTKVVDNVVLTEEEPVTLQVPTK